MKNRSKFNVDRSAVGKLRRTLNGIVFDSAAERDYGAELEHKVKTKQISGYRRQVRYDLCACQIAPFTKEPMVFVCHHIVDFEVAMPDGSVEVHELKGYETAIWKLKYKMFKACWPDVKYIVIKPKGRK